MLRDLTIDEPTWFKCLKLIEEGYSSSTELVDRLQISLCQFSLITRTLRIKELVEFKGLNTRRTTYVITDKGREVVKCGKTVFG